MVNYVKRFLVKTAARIIKRVKAKKLSIISGGEPEVLNDLSRAERFLNAYAAIEKEMKRILESKDHRPFVDLVNKSVRVNPIIERYRFDLKEYGELRNAIVHDRAGGEIIAEPNSAVVKNIEHIAGLLLEPPRVIPLFKREVFTLPAGQPVARAIRDLSKLSYTQAPIMKDGIMQGLLTLKMIVQWMGQSLANNSFDIEKTTIGDLLDQVGASDQYEYVSAGKSLLEIPDLFYRWQDQGKKLEAILITKSGKKDEPLLGIITNRDLPLVHRSLE